MEVKLRLVGNGDTGQSLPADQVGWRLATGVVVSIVVNGVLWMGLSTLIHTHVTPPPQIIEITRVVMQKDKIVPIKLKPTVIPHPLPKPIIPKPVQQTTRPIPKAPPPPTPHVHIATATPTPSPSPSESTVNTGGHLAPGTPVSSEGTGEQTTPQPAPVPAPAPQPAPVPLPVPPPAPKPVSVAPAPYPAPVGPTQDAQPGNQIKPDIPDELKQEDYKSFVRVKVVVNADGTFTPMLRTSSGNTNIDQRVLDALKSWTWKPALKDGLPVDSTQYFRFEFEVN